MEKEDKEKVIAIIKQRILDEYRKHKNIDWAESAARKIYGTHLVEKENINNQEKEIINATKEFAKEYNMPYNKQIESMILNAMREAVKGRSMADIGQREQLPTDIEIGKMVSDLAKIADAEKER